MYCYVLKLLFLNPQSYFPNQAATSIYQEVSEMDHLGHYHLAFNLYKKYICCDISRMQVC